MSEEKPWEDYTDPLGQKAAPVAAGPAAPEVGYTEDIAKGAAGGLGRGVSGLAGLPGDAAEYGARSIDWVARKFGAEPRAPRAPTYGSADVKKAIENYTGEFYEPKTLPGQYASTIVEFAPAALVPGGGGVGARVFNTIAGGLASESAGQLTKDTAAEPWARGIAGVAAAPLAGKLVTPAAPASAARQAAVGVFEREGIPVSAGARTGSKPVQWLEANAADMPGSAGRAAEMQATQAAAFDRAVTGRLFDPAELRARGVPEGVNLPDPRAVNAGRQSLSDEYTRLSQNQLRSDPQLQRDLLAAQTNYERSALPSQRAGGVRDVEQLRNDIVDNLLQGQGAMPGDVYQATRSRLGTLARGVPNDAPLSGALRDMRGALDTAMQRGLPPAEAAAWALNNRRYANMKQLEPAVARAGENLSPQAVAQTVRARRPGQYAAQQGDLDELSKAGAMLMKPMPQSGTAARLGMQKLFNIPAWLAAGGGAGAGGLVGGPIGAAAGAAAPFVASRLALSRPGQAYLGNQAMPQNARDAVAQALLQQAISQPGGIARNQAARTDYEQKRRDDLRKMGLQ
jgi:hypothetical protein